jgi:hypothetical protein
VSFAQPLGRFLTYVALFGTYVLAGLEDLLHADAVPGFSLIDEGLVVLLAGTLVLQAFSRVRLPRTFLFWIPYLFLFTTSLMVNHSSPVMAANLLFSYFKPFILALGAINFLEEDDLRLIFRLFVWFTVAQIPFLAMQLAKLGYVTGTLADDYKGFLGDAHLVGGLAIIPSIWVLGETFHAYRGSGVIPKGKLFLGLALFFIPIFCEAKHVYIGVMPGLAAFALWMDPKGTLRLIPKLAVLLLPMAALVFFFGFQYVSAMGYQDLFQLFQKLDAYAVTLFELPEFIHSPWLGAGPGMYGSAIAIKEMPPLAEHFFAEQLGELEVTGTFMNPFSEINGAMGELGYLGPVLLLLPYAAYLHACWKLNSRITDGFRWGALLCGSSLLLMIMAMTIIAETLVLHHILYPAFALTALVMSLEQRDLAAAGHQNDNS